MKNKHPKWSEDAEIGFVEWYNDEYGTYSCRLEWFQGDCEVEDEKTRKDLMYKWIHAAYASGYERGLRTLEELAQGHSKCPCDAL